jgi:antiviral helicase SKI2
LRGILATEINEGHPILIPELFLSEKAASLSAEELVCVLACFLEYSEKDEMEGPGSISALGVSDDVKEVLKHVGNLADKFLKLEPVGLSPDDYWALSLFWIDPIHKWIQGENIAILCKEYNIFEGNFTRAVLKINNLLDEWLSLATYCEHTAQIEKIVSIKSILVRDIIMPDSLYLRL